MSCIFFLGSCVCLRISGHASSSTCGRNARFLYARSLVETSSPSPAPEPAAIRRRGGAEARALCTRLSVGRSAGHGSPPGWTGPCEPLRGDVAGAGTKLAPLLVTARAPSWELNLPGTPVPSPAPALFSRAGRGGACPARGRSLEPRAPSSPGSGPHPCAASYASEGVRSSRLAQPVRVDLAFWVSVICSGFTCPLWWEREVFPLARLYPANGGRPCVLRGPPGSAVIRVLLRARPEQGMGLCPRTPSGCPGAGVKAGARAALSPGDFCGCSLKGNGEKALEEA